VVKDEKTVISWLQLGLTLLVQTALLASFVYGLHIRLCFLEDSLKESRADRVLLHAELRTFDETRYRIEDMVIKLDSINKKLDIHVEKDK
jgi:hypothetical protein